MNASYAAENAAERRRLFELTAKSTDTALARDMANDWSVAAKLVHLAFWDQHYLALIGHWERDGFSPPAGDAINAAVRFLSRAIPPRAVVELARASADAIDRRLETISPGLEAAIEATGRVRLLRRAMHRREHLDQIEDALRARAVT